MKTATKPRIDVPSGGNGHKRKIQATVLVPKGAPSHLLEKFKKNIVKRDDYLEYSVRGAKAQGIAEIAQVIKWLSMTDAKSCFEMLEKDYLIYGNGSAKAANIYLKSYLKKFGIKDPKIAQTKKFENGDTKNIVQIWSRTPVDPNEAPHA